MWQLTKTKLKNISISRPYIAWHVASILIMGIMVGSVSVSTYLIYQSVFKTVENAGSIVFLSEVVSFESINKEYFEEARKIVELKKNPLTVPPDLRNIFIYVEATTSTLSVPDEQEE